MPSGDALNAKARGRAKTQKAAAMKFGAITNSWRERLASASIEALVGEAAALHAPPLRPQVLDAG